jgi:hypothetical protein
MSLTRALARALSGHGDQGSLRARLRRRRIAPLMAMVAGIHAQKGSVQILDVGGTATYWGILPEGFLDRHDVYVTVVNVPGSALPADAGRFRYRVADGCDLHMFAENSFDIAHANSVIEHVGDWPRMQAFAGEISRVAPCYLVQTPNYWFPLEPHCMTPFFHWLPKPLRVWMVMRHALGHWQRAHSVDAAVRTVDSARLLDRRQFAALFPGARILTERFLGLPKSLVAVRDTAASC